MAWWGWLILVWAEVAAAMYVRQRYNFTANRELFEGESLRYKLRRETRMVTDSLGWFLWVLYLGVQALWKAVVG